ncbi:MAG: type II secretion system protein GspL [Sphingomonas bacterium]
MTRLLLFLPPDADTPMRWLRIEGDAVAARGEGAPEAVDAPVVAVAPADAVALHWASLPDRSAAQALAAARIVAGEVSAAPPERLHVAVGEGQGTRPIAIVAPERMREWLDSLAAIGLDPVAIVPAPLMLPAPEEGFLRAEIGGQAVIRGAARAFADEEGLTALIVGDAPVETLTPAEVERVLLARPLLDLRQGAFARRRAWAVDWRAVRRLGLVAGLVLLVTLGIALATIARYALAADRLEREADAVARQALPRGADGSGDAARALEERLSLLRGPGQGFTRTAAAAVAALRATPGSALSTLDFQPNGDLALSVTVDGDAQANALQARLRDAGFVVNPGAFESTGGKLKGQLMVTAP